MSGFDRKESPAETIGSRERVLTAIRREALDRLEREEA